MTDFEAATLSNDAQRRMNRAEAVVCARLASLYVKAIHRSIRRAEFAGRSYAGSKLYAQSARIHRYLFQTLTETPAGVAYYRAMCKAELFSLFSAEVTR